MLPVLLDTLVVKFRPHARSNARVRAVVREVGGKAVDSLLGMWVRIQVAVAEAGDLFQRYLAHPDVEDVEFNVVGQQKGVEHYGVATTDQMLQHQWGLFRMNLPAGWKFTTGSPSVPVAVIDNGFWWPGGYFIDFDGKTPQAWITDDVDPDADLGPLLPVVPPTYAVVADQVVNKVAPVPNAADYVHGNGVVAVIGGKANKQYGIAPVSPGATMMSFRVPTIVLDSTDFRQAAWTVDYFKAMKAAVGAQAKGAKIQCWPWASRSATEPAYVADTLNTLRDAGILVVAATGSWFASDQDGLGPVYPWPAKGMHARGHLSVGSITNDPLDMPSTEGENGVGENFNYGNPPTPRANLFGGTGYGPNVSIVAPGRGAWAPSEFCTAATFASGEWSYWGNAQSGGPTAYSILKGESAAAGFVAGVAHLVWSILDPDGTALPAEQVNLKVRSILLATVDRGRHEKFAERFSRPASAANPATYDLFARPCAGVVDAGKALAMATAFVNQGAVVPSVKFIGNALWTNVAGGSHELHLYGPFSMEVTGFCFDGNGNQVDITRVVVTAADPLAPANDLLVYDGGTRTVWNAPLLLSGGVFAGRRVRVRAYTGAGVWGEVELDDVFGHASTVPPVTTPTVSATVTLSATGENQPLVTKYRQDGGPWQRYTQPLARTVLLEFFSVDGAGLVEGGVDHAPGLNVFPVPDDIDRESPTVTGFACGTPTGLTVPVTVLTATDNVLVTAFCVTDSATPPSSDSPLWSPTPPSEWVAPNIPGASGPREVTIYAHARDAIGNAGSSAGVTVTVVDPEDASTQWAQAPVTGPLVEAFWVRRTGEPGNYSGYTLGSYEENKQSYWTLDRWENGVAVQSLATSGPNADVRQFIRLEATGDTISALTMSWNGSAEEETYLMGAIDAPSLQGDPFADVPGGTTGIDYE